MQNLFLKLEVLRQFTKQVSHTMLFIIVILLAANYGQCEKSSACGVFVHSTCMDKVTTKWNKYFIGENLKKWFRSIKRIITLEDKEHSFLRKTLLMFEEKDIISGKRMGYGAQIIAIWNCTIKKHFGPTWSITSVFSSNQFHDGFLYGKEDNNEQITGPLLAVILNVQ